MFAVRKLKLFSEEPKNKRCKAHSRIYLRKRGIKPCHATLMADVTCNGVSKSKDRELEQFFVGFDTIIFYIDAVGSWGSAFFLSQEVSGLHRQCGD